MDAFMDEKEKKRKARVAKRKQQRAAQSPAKLAEVKQADTRSREKARAQLTPARAAGIRHADNESRDKARAQLTLARAAEIRDGNTGSREKARAGLSPMEISQNQLNNTAQHQTAREGMSHPDINKLNKERRETRAADSAARAKERPREVRARATRRSRLAVGGVYDCSSTDGPCVIDQPALGVGSQVIVTLPSGVDIDFFEKKVCFPSANFPCPSRSLRTPASAPQSLSIICPQCNAVAGLRGYGPEFA